MAARHMNSDVEDDLIAYARRQLDDRLSKLTPEQRTNFDRAFPKGVSNEKLVTAIGLCNRTIRMNEGAPFPYSARTSAADPTETEAKP